MRRIRRLPVFLAVAALAPFAPLAPLAGPIAAGAAPMAVGGGLTPGLAAGGIPLTAGVEKVGGLLGPPSDQLQDPTNPHVYIQRWEALCLGARYTPLGELLALDVWADLGEACPDVGRTYAVDGAGGQRIAFQSTRGDVKKAFGYRPDRVLRAPRFTILVYDTAGIAFYIREGGERNGLVDAITIFPRHASRTVWAPASWRGG